MRRAARVAIALACWQAIAALLPGAAGAATTVGQNFEPTLQVGTKATILQLSSSAGTPYAVPYDGILTSWTFRTGPAAEPMRFKVARPAGGSQFTIVGQSEMVSPAPDTLNTFPIQIAVKRGDVIGFYQEKGETPAGARGDSESDQVAYAFGADPVPGETPTYFQISGIRFNISASLEVDRDGDGFGDESQDLCPIDGATHDACTADLALTARLDKASVGAFEELTVEATVENRGRTPAKGATLRYTVPAQFELVAITSRACRRAATIVCTLGPLQVGESATIAFTLRARTWGRTVNPLAVASDVADPDAANNTVSLAVTVAFKLGRCANRWAADGDNNALLGSPAGDFLSGLGGHDLLSGLAGDDCLDGGEGVDRMLGGDGSDSLTGGPGDDSLSGDAGGDRLAGDDGRDKVSGGPGADRIDGGAGSDNIYGLSGDDRLTGGPSRDRMRGGPGDDVLNARDGVKETVDCGTGRHDRARVDRSDRVRDCERVSRR